MYCKCFVNVLEIFCRYIVNVLRNILKWFSVVRSSIRWPSTATKYLESCCWRYNQLFYHSLLSQKFQENVLHSFKKMYFGQEKFFWNLKKLYFRSHYQIFPLNQARHFLPLAGKTIHFDPVSFASRSSWISILKNDEEQATEANTTKQSNINRFL